MSELRGLELRRAACEALGWIISYQLDSGVEMWLLEQPDKNNAWFGDPHEATSALPAIESDPAVSEPMFLEWCAKSGVTSWNLSTCGPHDQWTTKHFVVWVTNEERDWEGEGATPSEAYARAIVASAASEVKG